MQRQIWRSVVNFSPLSIVTIPESRSLINTTSGITPPWKCNGYIWPPWLSLLSLCRKWTEPKKGSTSLQRIGIGIFLGILTMAVGATLESKRKDVARKSNMLFENDAMFHNPLPISAFCLVPQFVLAGIHLQNTPTSLFVKLDQRRFSSWGGSSLCTSSQMKTQHALWFPFKALSNL